LWIRPPDAVHFRLFDCNALNDRLVGVACFPEHATSPEELVRATDEALYEAKLQGRDRVVTAGPRLLPLTARPGQAKGRAARVE
jgi:Diguanylate cyclase, GGDEF domain